MNKIALSSTEEKKNRNVYYKMTQKVAKKEAMALSKRCRLSGINVEYTKKKKCKFAKKKRKSLYAMLNRLKPIRKMNEMFCLFDTE